MSLCQTCKGRGQTRATETVMVRRAEPLYVKFVDGPTRKISMRTIKQGSGCPACLGTGHQPTAEEATNEMAALMKVVPPKTQQRRRQAA